MMMKILTQGTIKAINLATINMTINNRFLTSRIEDMNKLILMIYWMKELESNFLLKQQTNRLLIWISLSDKL